MSCLFAILVGCDLALVVTIVGGAHLLRQTAFRGVPRGNFACGRHLSQPGNHTGASLCRFGFYVLVW